MTNIYQSGRHKAAPFNGKSGLPCHKLTAYIWYIKAFNKARELAAKKEEEEPAPPEDPKPTTEDLLGEILEELKKK